MFGQMAYAGLVVRNDFDVGGGVWMAWIKSSLVSVLMYVPCVLYVPIHICVHFPTYISFIEFSSCGFYPYLWIHLSIKFSFSIPLIPCHG